MIKKTIILSLITSMLHLNEVRGWSAKELYTYTATMHSSVKISVAIIDHRNKWRSPHRRVDNKVVEEMILPTCQHHYASVQNIPSHYRPRSSIRVVLQKWQR